MLLNQIQCPGDLLLHFHSLSDKEIREIVLVKDDGPPSFVFNHFTKIGDVALKCNYICYLKTRPAGNMGCRGNMKIATKAVGSGGLMRKSAK